MRFEAILWDQDDDPAGNVQHCADHGVTMEEVEEALENAVDADISRSSGRPVVFPGGIDDEPSAHYPQSPPLP